MEQLNNPRELRGLAILSMGNAITPVSKNVWVVKSQTGIGEYKVEKHGKIWTCTCPDYAEHQTTCKHGYCIQFSLKLKSRVEDDVKKEMPEESAIESDNCPNCKGSDIIKKGVRHTQNGDVQVFGCKTCDYRFTPDKGFSRMKSDPNAILVSMDLYFKGVSLRKICDHLEQFYNMIVDPTTPMRWVRKYLKILSQYAEDYKVDVGNIWHSDEMTIFIKKEGQEKYYEWMWNVMDAETRYLLACRVTKTRFVSDARKPLKDAKKRATLRPDVIVTDGLQAYKSAIPKEFYDKHAEIKNPHLRLKDFETKPNNNIIERLNGTYRERMKVIRSFSTKLGAEDYAEAMRIYYNYIRPHQGIDGMTPAQMTGVPIDLSGNRWQTMIQLATLKSHAMQQTS